MPAGRTKRAREEEEEGDRGRHAHYPQSDTARVELSPTAEPALRSPSENQFDRLQAVLDWAVQHGASAPKLRLGRGKYGWGVFATADIAPSEEIASIPLTLVLTHQRADDSSVGAAVRELNDRQQSSDSLPHPAVLISPRTTLYLYMIQQLADPTAFFHPYLASLSPPCSPLLWPPSSLDYLTGTNLHAAVPNKLRQLRARYDNCVPLLCESFPAVFAATVFTFDRFLWAHTQLTSRGFPVRVGERAVEDRVTAGELREEGSKRPNERVGCLLPLLDMTNHRMRTGISWTTTSSNDARVTFQAGSSGGVSAGDEVFNNYGAKSNEEFLLGYGFCIDDNPYDEYTVQLGGLDGETAYMLDLLRLPWRDKGYYLTADSTPQQLLTVLRLAVMTEAEREVCGWQWVERGEVGDAVGVRNEVAMLDQLHQLLMSRLTKLSHHTLEQAETAEQQDRARLAQADMAEDERLALVYQKGQRHILIQRIKHTRQAKADLLTRTASLPSYRLSSQVTKADEVQKEQLEQLAAAWERAINPVLPPSSVALSVPSALLITSSSIRQSETFVTVLEYAAGLTAHQELTLFVLHHLQLGTASPYAVLFSFLHHPAHPSRALPSLVETSVEYADALDVYEQLFPALIEADPALFSTFIHSRDNWLWAHYIVHRHTLLLPMADEFTFLPVISTPPSDMVWRGRVEWDEQQLNIACDVGAGDVRVVYQADAEDDSRSVWTRGEYVVGSHPIVRIAASSLFTALFIAAQLSTHQALFALFQTWDDEQADSGHFHVGERGVSGGLLAWCRLLSMTTEEIAALMQHSNEAVHQTHPTAVGSGVVLDTDEQTETEPAAGVEAELEDEEAEEERVAHEQSALPRENMRRLLLAGPHELPNLVDWQRIRTSGWRQLHSVLHAHTEMEAANMSPQDAFNEGTVVGAVEVPWARLQAVHARDRMSVLSACALWLKGRMTD